MVVSRLLAVMLLLGTGLMSVLTILHDVYLVLKEIAAYHSMPNKFLERVKRKCTLKR